MTKYQDDALLDGRTAWSSRGGVRIDDPINMADQSELDEFGKLFCSADFGAKSGLLIDPPLLRRMMKEGELKVVPHEAFYDAQAWAARGDTVAWNARADAAGGKDKNRSQDKCPKFATNMDFLPIPEDYVVKSIAEYYPVDNEGNGYHIGADGTIRYPVVYVASTRGCIFSCHREWVHLKTAKRHLEAGSADILGRRTVPEGDLYLIRTFHQIFHTGTIQKVKRRFFTGRHYTMDGSSLQIFWVP
jgi:hypothetical protein